MPGVVGGRGEAIPPPARWGNRPLSLLNLLKKAEKIFPLQHLVNARHAVMIPFRLPVAGKTALV